MSVECGIFDLHEWYDRSAKGSGVSSSWCHANDSYIFKNNYDENIDLNEDVVGLLCPWASEGGRVQRLVGRHRVPVHTRACMWCLSAYVPPVTDPPVTVVFWVA